MKTYQIPTPEEQKIYVAGPFFNEEQVKIIETIEKLLGINEVEFYSPRHDGVLGEMSPEEQKENRKRIFNLNCQKMDESNLMIACVDFKDTGTIWEMGYFFASNKPLIMYARDLSKINVMLAESAYSVVCGQSELSYVLSCGVPHFVHIEEIE